ncbi:hypothetical protein [Priestia aryabhattai]|uniref:hypothetical protein n=1 Tax=Priestia aryabhattai TaxID=412384 RepID=UPI0015F40D7F|nr:hypothetical protein [Priestia aryabhattai]
MKKLTEEQLEVLVQKRNNAGEEAIVAIMNNEELASYRINCVEAIERLKDQIKRMAGGITAKYRTETLETLEGYVAYIDAKLSEEDKTEATGEAAIDQFLAAYKERAIEFFTRLTKEYRELKYKNYEITVQNLESVTDVWGERKYSNDQIEKIMDELNDKLPFQIDHLVSEIRRSRFKSWKQFYTKSVMKIVENVYYIRNDEDRAIAIEAIVTKDCAVKKENIYKIVEGKAGKIIDAKHLRVGVDGELNGIIQGEKDKVSVTSFTAGGHNIQKLHWRLKVTVAK